MKYPIIFIILCLLISCQKETTENPKETVQYIPVYNLGDTLKYNNQTVFEETEIIIDSMTKIGIKLTVTQGSIPNQSSYNFIRFNYDFNDKIKFLDSFAFGGQIFKGPLLTTFDYGDTIKYNITDDNILSWFPQNEIQMGNSGWIKYHIFTVSQGGTMYNVKIGENYVVFKFGENGNERIGWLNLVYQDNFCFIKEGYYISKSNEGIVVGKK